MVVCRFHLEQVKRTANPKGCAMSTPSLPFPQSLAEKYRPKAIAEFIGLEKPKRILAKFAAQPYPSAWLFVGPSGVGKTSMAQALCAAIGGELHHIPSQKCTVDTIEKACHDCHYLPFSPGKFHIVLCDEADRMTPAAQLALLSKLDATAFPPNTIFVFTCNETGSLEPRFLSRCRVIEFSSYGMAGEIAAYLDKVWHAESGNGNAPDLSRLAKEARNNVRDCLMRLEVELMAM
jgi:DNA polymerase III gamma/tau subunit